MFSHSEALAGSATSILSWENHQPNGRRRRHTASAYDDPVGALPSRLLARSGRPGESAGQQDVQGAWAVHTFHPVDFSPP
jgi:hypothetical protein